MRSVLLRHSAAVTSIAAVLIIGFVLGQTGSRAAAATDGGELPDWAMKAALAVAAANADAAPDSVQYAATTPAKAAAVIDEESVDTKSRVYVVLMRGDFVLHTAHLPVGVDPPAADWIMLILDPSDESVAGMAAAKGVPDTSAIGAMSDVKLEAQ